MIIYPRVGVYSLRSSTFISSGGFSTIPGSYTSGLFFNFPENSQYLAILEDF